jgi:hypothetical protein
MDILDVTIKDWKVGAKPIWMRSPIDGKTEAMHKEILFT